VCVSLINMKGGVGKTTIATQIAWYAAVQMNKKVLLIDLDPQANASQSVMSPQPYVSYLDDGGLTVANIFEEFTPTGIASGSPRKLDPLKTIYERVNYADGGVLHLVPSPLELSWTLRNPAGKETLLARFVAKIEAKYDLIIIDCSPTDSMLTDAAYHCSRHILVPIRAEFLPAIGFHWLGREEVEEKARQYRWYIFEHDIPHSDSYFRAAREGLPIDNIKGVHHKVKTEFTAFAREFFGRIGL
jgi:chromosome partitioning protein